MAVHKKYDRNVLGRGLDNIGDGKGKGLDALINTKDVETEGSSNLSEIAIERITSNPNQPRREFDEEALTELANSIREIGIITPITLRQMADGRYQIIAGERRWRAAKTAGLTTIPAYIRTVEDEGVMEMALVENIQREDLNAIEIALAYQHMADSVGMTQEKIRHQLHASVEIARTDTDGTEEPRNRHGTRSCFAVNRQSVCADKTVQGHSEEQLLCT